MGGGRGRVKGSYQDHQTHFGGTQHSKQASGGISHSGRAERERERERMCVKMGHRNTVM